MKKTADLSGSGKEGLAKVRERQKADQEETAQSNPQTAGVHQTGPESSGRDPGEPPRRAEHKTDGTVRSDPNLVRAAEGDVHQGNPPGGGQDRKHPPALGQADREREDSCADGIRGESRTEHEQWIRSGGRDPLERVQRSSDP